MKHQHDAQTRALRSVQEVSRQLEASVGQKDTAVQALTLTNVLLTEEVRYVQEVQEVQDVQDVCTGWYSCCVTSSTDSYF
jgi:sensor c-di-GMP phosphodiesterase-like protein